MSHDLEIVNGEAQMAFVGERTAIWHRLGKQVPDDLTPQQMMEAAGLDWEVQRVPLSGTWQNPNDPADEVKIGTGHSALVRSTDKRVLDVVTNTWNPVQNAEAFEFFNEFVETGDMKMNTAGSINDGQRVWAMAKVQESFELFGGDVIESYLLFSNPHMFGRCVDIKFTPTRVVCQNTLSMALSEVSDRQVRHSHRTEFDAEKVKIVLGIARQKLNDYKEKASFLGSKRAKDEDIVEYFNRIFPVLTTNHTSTKPASKQAARAMEVLNTQPGAKFAEGSFWQAFNAVTYITNHEYGRSDENRLNSLWYGANAQRNLKALTVAMEMASA